MIIAIVGPTGVGKTALSIALAKHYKAEVINFDAMQVYEKMDIGTAKVTKIEMDGVKHHLLSYVDIDTNYSVYDYQKEARSLIDKLLKEKKNIGDSLVTTLNVNIQTAAHDALSTKNGTTVQKLFFTCPKRAEVREMTADFALKLLREQL